MNTNTKSVTNSISPGQSSSRKALNVIWSLHAKQKLAEREGAESRAFAIWLGMASAITGIVTNSLGIAEAVKKKNQQGTTATVYTFSSAVIRNLTLYPVVITGVEGSNLRSSLGTIIEPAGALNIILGESHSSPSSVPEATIYSEVCFPDYPVTVNVTIKSQGDAPFIFTQATKVHIGDQTHLTNYSPSDSTRLNVVTYEGIQSQHTVAVFCNFSSATSERCPEIAILSSDYVVEER